MKVLGTCSLLIVVVLIIVTFKKFNKKDDAENTLSLAGLTVVGLYIAKLVIG